MINQYFLQHNTLFDCYLVPESHKSIRLGWSSWEDDCCLSKSFKMFECIVKCFVFGATTFEARMRFINGFFSFIAAKHRIKREGIKKKSSMYDVGWVVNRKCRLICAAERV